MVVMNECEYLFSMAVQQKLKKQIIGKIFVKVTRDDELLVVIERDDEGLKFKTFTPNFTEKCLNGLTSDYIAYQVVKDYKTFLFERMLATYFYQD